MPTDEQRYIDAVRRLRKRVTMLEGMAAWKEDLEARLWRNNIVLRATTEALHDIEALQREVRLFNEVVQRLKGHGVTLVTPVGEE